MAGPSGLLLKAQAVQMDTQIIYSIKDQWLCWTTPSGISLRSLIE